MQDEIWHQRSIQNYNGAVLSVYSVVPTVLIQYVGGSFFDSKKYFYPQTFGTKIPATDDFISKLPVLKN